MAPSRRSTGTEGDEKPFQDSPKHSVVKKTATGKSQETEKRSNKTRNAVAAAGVTPAVPAKRPRPRHRQGQSEGAADHDNKSTGDQPVMAPRHPNVDTKDLEQAPPAIPQRDLVNPRAKSNESSSSSSSSITTTALLRLREQVVSQTVFAAPSDENSMMAADQRLKSDLRREQQEQADLYAAKHASRTCSTTRRSTGTSGSHAKRSRNHTTTTVRQNSNKELLTHASGNSVLEHRQHVMEHTVFATDNDNREMSAQVLADRRLKASLRRQQQEYATMYAAKAKAASNRRSTQEVFQDEPEDDDDADDDQTPSPLPQPRRHSNTSIALIQPGAYEGLPGVGFRRTPSDWKLEFRTRQSETALPTYNRQAVSNDGNNSTNDDDNDEDVDDNNDHLVQAKLVEDEEFGPSPITGVAKPAEQYHQEQKRRRLVWLIGILLILFGFLITGLIVGVIVRSQQTNAGAQRTTHPPGIPTFPPTATVMEGLANWTLLAIQNNRSSPQAQAYEWILNDPNREVFPNDRHLQRFALATLYYATNGFSWANNKHWLDYNMAECQWFHNTATGDMESTPIPILNHCDGSGDLIRLNLANNNLQGSIPPEIGLLTSLIEVHLENNEIQGSLPSQIGLLSRLDSMYVNNNTLGGPLPTELGMLSILGKIHIFDNPLTGALPTEIGLLSVLAQLHIQNSNIGGQLPTQLGNLVQLEDFLAWNTKFTGTLPSQMGHMGSLKSLALHNGELEGTIPTLFGLLSNLFMIQIDANRLSGSIPSELGKLTNTKVLSFGANQLSSTIPTELGLLSTALGALRFYQNRLVGTIPTELGQLGLVQRLELDGNNLTHTIPTQLGNMGYLQHVFLASNQLTGKLPSELGSLPFLLEITLQYNPQISSSIPLEWGDIASLEELFLAGVDITGSIPSQLCSLDRLAVDCDSNVCGCDCGTC